MAAVLLPLPRPVAQVGAGVEAPFEVRIMSGVPIELVPLPEVKCVVVNGEWKDDSSGGCDIHPLWKKNPRFLLVMSGQGRARITLTRLPKPGRKAVSQQVGRADSTVLAVKADGVLLRSGLLPSPTALSQACLDVSH